ncbi:MAG: RtcB family protein, partial [Myxococcales bacterium]|nr:RtcB family protein [Myxococcales bacterium]
MEPQRLKGFNVDVLLWADVNEVESAALTQLRKITSLPCVVHHVAAMPDVHLGRGATVGSVVAMKGAVCPAAVGVDIGCGMAAVRSTLKASDLPDSLSRLRGDIEAVVPTGFSMHDSPDKDVRSLALFREFETLTPKVHSDKSVALRQLGTLGGGNHFIEICLDEEDRVWVMLHSGSRRIGKLLAEIHIGRARRLAHNERLLDPDLAYFLAGTPEMDAYRRDLDWAQRYAWENRRKMLELVLAAV